MHRYMIARYALISSYNSGTRASWVREQYPPYDLDGPWSQDTALMKWSRRAARVSHMRERVLSVVQHYSTDLYISILVSFDRVYEEFLRRDSRDIWQYHGDPVIASCVSVMRVHHARHLWGGVGMCRHYDDSAPMLRGAWWDLLHFHSSHHRGRMDDLFVYFVMVFYLWSLQKEYVGLSLYNLRRYCISLRVHFLSVYLERWVSSWHWAYTSSASRRFSAR